MIRSIFILAPLPALLVFPAPFSIVLVGIATLLFPPAGVLYGTLADALYYAPGAASVPLGVIYGTAASIGGVLISRFVRTRVTWFSRYQ